MEIKTRDDIPSRSNLYGSNRFLQIEPTCPQGGKYTIHAVGEHPTCSLSESHSHSL